MYINDVICTPIIGMSDHVIRMSESNIQFSESSDQFYSNPVKIVSFFLIVFFKINHRIFQNKSSYFSKPVRLNFPHYYEIFQLRLGVFGFADKRGL